jgi:hypothetical protein
VEAGVSLTPLGRAELLGMTLMSSELLPLPPPDLTNLTGFGGFV